MNTKTASVIDDKFENIEFKDINELIFPKICLICGNKTESTFQKILYGKFIPEKSFKNNYYISLPICKDCQGKINIKNGFQNIWLKLLPIFALIGIVIMVIILLSTYSILMGISVIIFTSVIPIILYQRNIKEKINLDEYIDITLVEGEKDILKFSVINKNYARFLKKKNLN